MMNVLGIETSCDETAAAVVADGNTVLSSIVSSQIKVHQPYGGVVPELASRKHLEAIEPVVHAAITEAGLTKDHLDAVAVTRGPGLVGCLLVGFSFAKAFSFARNIPWVGVNHLEGHINSVFLTDDPPPFPFVALLASGGHTSIYHVTGHTAMDIMGQTRDDAVGEAFDKVSKAMGLGYPGGGILDKLARKGRSGTIRFPRTYLDKESFDFSFSGIKTAVNRYLSQQANTGPEEAENIAAEFQEAVVEVLVYKLLRAAEVKNCTHAALVGGVAANSGLRERLSTDAKAAGIAVHIPPLELCGDNAAMIAATGYHYLREGKRGKWDDDVFSRNRI